MELNFKNIFDENYYALNIEYDLTTIKEVMIKFYQNKLEGMGIEFDAFAWNFSELFGIILGMFAKYNLICNSESLINVLKFIIKIKSTYNEIPYHTFRHAMDVCYVTYYMLTDLQIYKYLAYSRLEVAALIISALGHDMYHPGYNNLFQINAKTEVAIKYDGKSVLERYSADTLIDLLNESNLFNYLNFDSVENEVVLPKELSEELQNLEANQSTNQSTTTITPIKNPQSPIEVNDLNVTNSSNRINDTNDSNDKSDTKATNENIQKSTTDIKTNGHTENINYNTNSDVTNDGNITEATMKNNLNDNKTPLNTIAAISNSSKTITSITNKDNDNNENNNITATTTSTNVNNLNGKVNNDDVNNDPNNTNNYENKDNENNENKNNNMSKANVCKDDKMNCNNDFKTLRKEKIKKYFYDMLMEVILNTDMSTHFQLQDLLSNISTALFPNIVNSTNIINNFSLQNSQNPSISMTNTCDNSNANINSAFLEENNSVIEHEFKKMDSDNINTNNITNNITSNMTSIIAANDDDSYNKEYEIEKGKSRSRLTLNSDFCNSYDEKSDCSFNEFIEKGKGEIIKCKCLDSSTNEDNTDEKKEHMLENSAFDYCIETLPGYCSSTDNFETQNTTSSFNFPSSHNPSQLKLKSDVEVYQLELCLNQLKQRHYNNLTSEQRRTILNGLLHAADISNAARPWYVCEAWSNRVVEEFWRQGDEEKRLNLPISPNMDRDRFERNGISLVFNDIITTPFYEVLYELIPSFELFVKLLRINRSKWNELISISKMKNSENSMINSFESDNLSDSDLSIPSSIEEIKSSSGQDHNNSSTGRRLSIAAGTIIIPETILSKITKRNEYSRSLSVQSDHYPKYIPMLNISRVSSSYLALNSVEGGVHASEFHRSRPRENNTDSTSTAQEKNMISQSTQLKNINLDEEGPEQMESSVYRSRRCQSVDTSCIRHVN